MQHRPDVTGTPPTGTEPASVEVKVYDADGDLIARELCESAEHAAAVVEHWSEQEGVTCVVDDATVRHRPGLIDEPEAESWGAEDDHPRDLGEPSA